MDGRDLDLSQWGFQQAQVPWQIRLYQSSRWLTIMEPVRTVSAILQSPDGRFLLQLRDDNPKIQYRNFWTAFGGAIEPGETPEQCLRRELEEEIGFIAKDVTPWRIIPWKGFLVHVFEVPIDKEVSDLVLNEGADMRFFTKDDILGMDLAFCFSEVYLDYFDERAKLRGITAILRAPDGRILLQKRDDIQSIPFPSMWSPFGGGLEPGESAEEGLRRELSEELEFEPRSFQLWKVKMVSGYLDYIFEIALDLDVGDLSLHEGMDMGLFTQEEIQEMELAFGFNSIFEEYFKERPITSSAGRSS